MAKRLTDTGKWNDDWFLELDNDYKTIWQWLLDNCDHAGFCKRSTTLMNMVCRTSISESDMIEKMCGRVLIHNDYWFIPKFIKFQYPTLLSGKPAILSVVRILFDKGAIELIPKSFGNDYIIIEQSFSNHCKMIKDMVKDIVKDKDCISVLGNFQNFYSEIKNQNPSCDNEWAKYEAKQMEGVYANEKINDITALVRTWVENKKVKAKAISN